MTQGPAAKNPALAGLSPDVRVQILTAAYQKHAAELLAIQDSQEKLNNLVLGIYSAGLTLVAAIFKEAEKILKGPNHTPSAFAWAFIALAIIIGIYALYMTKRRGHAREGVRTALTQIDQALGFFQPGVYLQGEPLYPLDWLEFPKHKFLNWSVGIVIAAGIAFIATVYFVAVS